MGKKLPREADMQKRIILFFDIVALTGFGAYMAMTIWRLPDELRGRLLTTSLSILARLTTGTG
ncbi:hypothetical protein DVDV_0548 [Desulfovibrio sp. DV]|uniref:hypothetical protein n=1 Tax=Desulfovibrio sp. DV TaxID=1844708 RepID=UPI00094BB160|nr:hypothetical protein [Desulfovibrio sp. DV]OLN30592.1 hypothetical protein DVDV_0548 [Desulfovibrio sp. DV]